MYPRRTIYICTLSVFSPTKSVVYICDLTPVDVLFRVATPPPSVQPFPLLSPALHARTPLHIPNPVITSIVEAYHAEQPQILQGQGQGQGRGLCTVFRISQLE